MSGTTAGVTFNRTGDDIHKRIFRGKSINSEAMWGGKAPIELTGYEAKLQIRDPGN